MELIKKKNNRMEFSVPTNWQPELIKGIALANRNREIKEVYGKLIMDDIGGGRIASSLPFISRSSVVRHIRELHEEGLKFNYLINAVCLDNFEFTRPGQKKIRRLIDWVVNSGADSVTVANPYLMMWVKKNYPFLSLNVSVMANVDSLEKAKFWEGLGADKIGLPGPALNRNFKMLKLLRKALKCKIQLVANNACLCNCPTYINHAVMSCHASQKWHRSKGFMLDYYVLMCRLERLKNPENIIRSDWIRPEDIGFYEELGVDSIKLVDRRCSTEMIIKIINAYTARTYQGNISELFPFFSGRSFDSHRGWVNKIFNMGDISSFNPFKVWSHSKLFSKVELMIDNQQLTGFIQNFPQGCDLVSCDKCGYCRKIASMAVRFDKAYLDKMIEKYKMALNMLFEDGLSFFKTR
ncbi:MAG: U32 family peptidase [Candidatus Omnitrophota bacterium]